MKRDPRELKIIRYCGLWVDRLRVYTYTFLVMFILDLGMKKRFWIQLKDQKHTIFRSYEF